ncbi:MAG: tetratricopeptide repeat protein, partial [Cyanobacteria bacterium P01_A01_bin.135]
IGNRLGEVEQVIRDRPNPDYGLLLQIADAYKTLRERDRAIAAYSDIIQRANQRGDIATEATALAALGEVHLAWFDYGSARPVYQRLLTLRQQQQDTLGEQQALGKLVIVYDETTQPDAAIDARQALVRRYRQSGDLSQVPGLKIAIAERHRELGQLNAAVQAYQEAAVTGQRIGFVGYVADAYRGLASLYLESDRPRDALTAYRFLVDAERQAYNTYGMMEAFDQIGQIHRSLGANQPAIAAFQRGLALAQQLSYRTAYFTAQIQSVQGQ